MSAAVKRKLAAWALGLALLGVAAEAWRLQAAYADNAAIAALLAGRDAPLGGWVGRPAPVLAARALYLARHGREDEAKVLWDALDGQGTGEERAQAAYNLGTFYLQAALDKVEAGRLEQAATRAALAKQALRRALQWQPDYWDAKFNLEIAMRLLPEMDRFGQADEEEPPDARPKALWTQVPGFPRGRP